MTDPQTTSDVLLYPGIDACPFCGCAGIKGAELLRKPDGKTVKVYSIMCTNNRCNAYVPGDTFEKARTKWNQRQ